MKNGLTDLNNYLFEQIERLNDDTLSAEELKIAVTKANAITQIADTIIKNGELALKIAVVQNKNSENSLTNLLISTQKDKPND